MAGVSNQKLKTFYILRFLESRTDEAHGVTVEEIIEHLATLGISAERKSVYSDLELLRTLDIEIESVRGKQTTYHILSRSFELPELKLLVDAVGASRFITHKKSHQLIKKLESLTSIYEAAELRRNVHVDRRIKSMNENIYYSIDAIHAAINGDKMLRFKYFSYSRDKERIQRRDGGNYLVAPLALVFSDDNYYLYAYDIERSGLRTYRVDRMTAAEVLSDTRSLPSEYRDFDPAAHTNEMFAMFGGERRSVTLRFDNRLATVVIDRFGVSASLIPDGDAHFTVTIDVMISPTFMGWLFEFGAAVRIIGPDDVAQQYADMAREVATLYTL